jgi:hypothetical protein
MGRRVNIEDLSFEGEFIVDLPGVGECSIPFTMGYGDVPEFEEEDAADYITDNVDWSKFDELIIGMIHSHDWYDPECLPFLRVRLSEVMRG